MSLSSPGECAYQVIISTEIIGLSHAEREIVANVVKFNHTDFVYYDDIIKGRGISKDAYLVIAKLTALLRLAGAPDVNRNLKDAVIKVSLHEDELWMQAETSESIEFERTLFTEKSRFFEEVFNIRPVLKQKRMI